MKVQNEIDLAELVSKTESNMKEHSNTGHSLFILERGVYLQKPSELSVYPYTYCLNIKKRFDKFDKILIDEDFRGLNYVDVVGGPFNKEYDPKYWAYEISTELRMRKPENLIFYMRREPTILATRILIPISDFYNNVISQKSLK